MKNKYYQLSAYGSWLIGQTNYEKCEKHILPVEEVPDFSGANQNQR